ncbi:CDP-diacylglycerol--glycerol-3-phosphate 3-phosphatidyltransferase [Mycoplasmopsis agalactiae]|uniref:CDP-diacylglycerol--glycerol-3-phosphate 3-phosphatidyltransferase n=1 Tax=Mycoplasmopsis agalactiae (strain NCTC 10123 / CIP 59.7 / PG2) TaxID=347257 RepID=A5IZD4_MYCAP|nr:CDP-diacylglycerol--glycerol-3-phosphate 3-phosphatidyltransferase [Mycoplasmopsis agalactiae]MCE6057409.1 CDP-diacylglycerol--glycerol-3-phosphate 3-phosphatidyltransferase [Mycoplasmopsis agalactiae]MCE6079187.1 CDP-diacylglycerol--glycerol-3-phosphate 3-phosphatidyltransferase [Mycoplasmopsis agalactiae]MCE6095585.1 CDP-diacylglycerol--glycerol-3-phosphate 3-phosphatidyltransferase [Mycoplasmopsis agalactiae]MCE6114832.1 CDP-diacylglycerol--glycerol-3-phosphate 3-phosphatidyltransferase [
MNLPNKLTLLRMILFIPLLVLVILYGVLIQRHIVVYKIAGRILLSLILAIFIAAMITDYLDGWLARKNKQVTSFGKLFDPIADKLIVTTTLISLSIFGFIPLWITILFVARDLIVDAIRVLMAQNNIDVKASIWGKLKTLTQTIAIIIVLVVAVAFNFSLVSNWKDWLILYAINIPMLVALFFSIFSGYKYYHSIRSYIKTK